MNRHLVEIFIFFIMGIIFSMIPVGIQVQYLHAQERPVKEFFVTVQKTTITLLEDPKKEVTVWAYGLKGEQPSVPGPVIRVNKGDLVKVHFSNTHSRRGGVQGNVGRHRVRRSCTICPPAHNQCTAGESVRLVCQKPLATDPTRVRLFALTGHSHSLSA